MVDDDRVESIDISDINNPSLAGTYGNVDGSNPGFAKAGDLIQLSETDFVVAEQIGMNQLLE